MGRSLQAIPPGQGSPVLLSSLLAGGGDQVLILRDAQPGWELTLGVCSWVSAGPHSGPGGERYLALLTSVCWGKRQPGTGYQPLHTLGESGTLSGPSPPQHNRSLTKDPRPWKLVGRLELGDACTAEECVYFPLCREETDQGPCWIPFQPGQQAASPGRPYRSRQLLLLATFWGHSASLYPSTDINLTQLAWNQGLPPPQFCV